MPQTTSAPKKPQKVSEPRAQTLSTTIVPPRRRVAPIPAFSFKLGDSIGDDLTVIGHLGRGRISELYQVWSVSYTCALTCKILMGSFAPQSREVRDFKKEAMLLKRLEHPQIVRIFKRGNYEGREYLVQEYLHGPSLFELIELSPKRQLPVSDSIKTIVQVCSALDHLHAQGYIYRDVKPSNIILRGGIPILVDFDAAYKLKPGRKPGRRIGTDPYMAPEQCLRQELFPSTDIYGLGALFYEMLSGRWPYEDELVSPRKEKTLRSRFPQIGGNPPPPPERFNQGVSPELSSLIMRCLNFDPQTRFATARELIKELVTFLSGKDQMWPESVDLRNRVA